jgi:hypothetical protein
MIIRLYGDACNLENTTFSQGTLSRWPHVEAAMRNTCRFSLVLSVCR